MRGFSVMHKPHFTDEKAHQDVQKPYLKAISTSNRRKNARRKAMQQLFEN